LSAAARGRFLVNGEPGSDVMNCCLISASMTPDQKQPHWTRMSCPAITEFFDTAVKGEKSCTYLVHSKSIVVFDWVESIWHVHFLRDCLSPFVN
jgi:hypothetical protein